MNEDIQPENIPEIITVRDQNKEDNAQQTLENEQLKLKVKQLLIACLSGGLLVLGLNEESLRQAAESLIKSLESLGVSLTTPGLDSLFAQVGSELFLGGAILLPLATLLYSGIQTFINERRYQHAMKNATSTIQTTGPSVAPLPSKFGLHNE